MDKILKNLEDEEFVAKLHVGGLYSRLFNKDATVEEKIDYLLLFSPVAASGQERTIKWLLNPGTTSYGGGAIVSYVILDNKCNVKQADTLCNYKGYQRARNEAGYIKQL